MSNQTVLLLEAGGDEPFFQDIPGYYTYLKDSRLNWRFQTEPEKFACGGKSCTWMSGKVLGGGSVLNAMIYHRGIHYDYDNWEKLGNEGWSFKDVLPYFLKSENNLDPDIASDTKYHSVGGYQSVSRFPYQDKVVKALYEAFVDLNYPQIDVNAEHSEGTMLAQATSENGERRSTNLAFLQPVQNKRPNLKVVTNTRVTKVLIEPTKKVAYGVEYALENHRSKTGVVFASKEVVISAGAINSPHILMLSGIGKKEVLEPLGIPVIIHLEVGQNLQTHPSSTAVSYNVGDDFVNVTDVNVLKDVVDYLQPKRNGPWSSTATAQVTASVRTKYADHSIEYPDIQFYIATSTVKSDCPADLPWPICYYNRLNILPNILRPKSTGNVTISSKDPFTNPKIYANYFVHPDDKKVLIAGSRLATQLQNTTIFKSLGYSLDKSTGLEECADMDYDSDDYWLCVARERSGFLYHHSCTCKMGNSSDPTAVVDPQLRVYGVKRLRVVDTSIMPNIVSGNPNAPVIMIAEKASDMIKSAWRAL